MWYDFVSRTRLLEYTHLRTLCSDSSSNQNLSQNKTTFVPSRSSYFSRATILDLRNAMETSCTDTGEIMKKEEIQKELQNHFDYVYNAIPSKQGDVQFTSFSAFTEFHNTIKEESK